MVSRRAGSRHHHGLRVNSWNLALHRAYGAPDRHAKMLNSYVDTPELPRWRAAGSSRQLQQALNQDAPLMLLFLQSA